MSYYYCNICDTRIKYLHTPQYKALFKCLFNEYNFKYQEFLELEKMYVKYIKIHSETIQYPFSADVNYLI